MYYNKYNKHCKNTDYFFYYTKIYVIVIYLVSCD